MLQILARMEIGQVCTRPGANPLHLFLYLKANGWGHIFTSENSNLSKTKGKKINKQVNITYSFGTNGVLLTFGCTTSPTANIPPPLLPSKQCEKIFFTFLDEASCERIDVFACPKPTIPSTASEDEPSSPDCLAEHLSQIRFIRHRSGTRNNF